MNLKIINKRKETKNIFSLILEKPLNFSFYPGQFLDIELPVSDSLGKTRIFSISSSPTEDFLMLTYQIGITPYKQSLQNLRRGDFVKSSYPAGTVVIDDSSPAVMMAGGIGIAPHRSMIKYVVDQKLNLPITLIYSNSDPDFTFKKELSSWQKLYPKLKIHYVVTGKSGRLTAEKLHSMLPTTNYQLPIFYLAGPPKMVDDFEEILLKLGVDSTNIRTDRFDGY